MNMHVTAYRPHTLTDKDNRSRKPTHTPINSLTNTDKFAWKTLYILLTLTQSCVNTARQKYKHNTQIQTQIHIHPNLSIEINIMLTSTVNSQLYSYCYQPTLSQPYVHVYTTCNTYVTYTVGTERTPPPHPTHTQTHTPINTSAFIMLILTGHIRASWTQTSANPPLCQPLSHHGVVLKGSPHPGLPQICASAQMT